MAATQVTVRRKKCTDTGFSFLELVVALAIMAVLLTIAFPGYQQYVQRAERAEAVRFLLAVADCQERIRADRGGYDTTECLDGAPADHYRFLLEPADEGFSPRFRVLAEPERQEGNQCGALGLDHTGARSISDENGILSECWGGR